MKAIEGRDGAQGLLLRSMGRSVEVCGRKEQIRERYMREGRKEPRKEGRNA